MHIVVYANFEKLRYTEIVNQLIKIFNKKSITFTLSSNYITEFENNKVYFLEKCIDEADILVVLGGDGTVLHAVKVVGTRNIPALCINLGKVGFLTEVEPENIENAIDLVLENKYCIDNRALLEIQYDGKVYFALNEVVLSKGTNTRPINIQVEYDHKLLDRYLADGLIVSTPTGSTAYSLSCGGPILGPDIHAIIVNTICAHSLHSRPIVMADSHEISFFATELYNTASMIVDGQFVINVEEDKPIIVKKAEHMAQFIKIDNRTFYDKLLKKLNYWGITTVDKE